MCIANNKQTNKKGSNQPNKQTSQIYIGKKVLMKIIVTQTDNRRGYQNMADVWF